MFQIQSQFQDTCKGETKLHVQFKTVSLILDNTAILPSHVLSKKTLKIKIYKTIVLSVTLYRYETWFVTLREEHKLRMSGNKVLRRASEPKRVEVIGG